MLKKFLLLTIASLVMLPALADKPDDKPDKGNQDRSVSLKFVFGDVGCGSSDKICSDDGGEYFDGVDFVSANIGKFRFGLNVGQNRPRNFFLDFTDCAIVSSMCPLFSVEGTSDYTTSGYTTSGNVFATAPDRAQYLKMSANEDGPADPDSQPVDFQLEFLDGNGEGWRIMFNPSKCPGDDLATMATVTKIADNPDTWVFEAGAGDVACLQYREGPHSDHLFYGMYSLPFEITATAWP